MQFSQYVSPMDRDYGKSSVNDNSTSDVGIGVQDIGMSVPLGLGAQNIQGIGAKIKAGAGAMEITFTGAGSGGKGSQTPGMYGKDQRQALRELAEVSEVKLTTHAAFNIMGLAGMDQQGNFSKEHRKFAVDEIKGAIEFAADAAKGGSVVVHTGEFQRPISEEAWALKDPNNPNKGYLFKNYGEEPERAVYRVIDDRTGHIIHQVKKNQTVARPIWNKFESDNKEIWDKKGGKEYTDNNGNIVRDGDYIDYEGNKILDPFDVTKGRVPRFDPKSGRFEVRVQKWEDFEVEARDRNIAEAARRGLTVDEFKVQFPDKYLRPEEALMQATLETQEGHSRGWALTYSRGFEEERKSLEKLKKSREFYAKLEDSVPEEERWKLMREVSEVASHYAPGLVPSEHKKPTEILDRAIETMEREIESKHQASVSQQQQAEDSRETQKHVYTAEKYALKESFKSYAEAGMHAMNLTKAKNLEKPLIITMENIFPESFGSHPDELRTLIQGSRKEMAKQLTERGMSQQEAEKTAETHIKATLDTGHLNMWRKYWQDDPNKSIQQNEADFKKWMLEKVDTLAKEKLIGNLHLVDNFGYQDDHLAPGQGTAPVKEVVAILKKHGYKDAITVEAGADATTDLGDFWGLMKAWRLFGSPVYGAHGPARADVPKANWSDLQYSYFGQVNPPYFVFGSYAPSQDWSLWSQTPLE